MGFRAAAFAVLAVSACTGDDGLYESRQGGDTTIDDRTYNAFAHPAPNLTMAEQNMFMNGASPFDFKWEIPQLGPVFNNDSCFNCHSSFGRGLSHICPAAMIVITVVCGMLYPATIWVIGLTLPSQSNGSLVSQNGQVVGSSLIGQSFTDKKGNALPEWFQSRPSAAVAGGDGSSSSASR